MGILGPRLDVGRNGKLRKADKYAPVAQMDRVLPSEGRSRTFESCRARQHIQMNPYIDAVGH